MRVKSSNVKTVTYDRKAEQVVVTFQNSKEKEKGDAPREYRYDAPKKFAQKAVASASKGRFFNAHGYDYDFTRES